MKLLVSIFQPQQLPTIKKALFESQIKHLTVTNVLGTAHEGAEVRTFRGVPHEVSLFQKVRVEIPLREELVEQAIEAITRGAKASGGFGIIFVTELHNFVNIGTGEQGDQAVQ